MYTFESKNLMNGINHQLAPFRKSQTEVMAGFGQLARAAMEDGAISAKHKELIALAIGIAKHCGGCVAFHVKALRRLGCTRQELEEMLGVCVYMGGGPGLMTAADALSCWDELEAASPTPTSA
jgi:AhpD family alkylhydroperoxidase